MPFNLIRNLDRCFWIQSFFMTWIENNWGTSKLIEINIHTFANAFGWRSNNCRFPWMPTWKKTETFVPSTRPITIPLLPMHWIWKTMIWHNFKSYQFWPYPYNSRRCSDFSKKNQILFQKIYFQMDWTSEYEILIAFGAIIIIPSGCQCIAHFTVVR